MKTITLQVPDELYEACLYMVQKYGRSAEEWVMEFLLKHTTVSLQRTDEEQRKAARERLRPHAGAQSLGHPTGVDNESIDANLANEYERHS
ncbi:hypothetical protein [Chloroflexus sp.]|uniref:hypothetical protein n=1 Tax=Chloroflexus sp. TaxID=1904827 RepID=UPI00404B8C9B